MENLELEQEIIQTEEAPIEHSLEALREGKISFKDIPKEKRHEIRMQARETLPDDEAKEAFDMGWSPKEFFLGKRADGSPKEFVDYKDFLKKINETAPVKNERLRVLSKENQEKDRQIQELQEQMRNLFEMNKMSQEREVGSQEERVRAELEEAEELGDIKTFKAKLAELNRIEEAKNKLKSFEKPLKEEPQAPQISQETMYELQTWIAKNDWYLSDPKITAFCNEQSALLARTEPDVDLADRLEAVKQLAIARYPQLTPKISKPTVLASKTTGFSAPAKTTMTFERLPEREKKTAEWLLKSGVYKSKAEIVQAYLKRSGEAQKA